MHDSCGRPAGGGRTDTQLNAPTEHDQAVSPLWGTRQSGSPMGFGARRHRHNPLMICASVLNERHPLGVDDFADVPHCPHLPYHGDGRSSALGACLCSITTLSVLACVERKLAGPYDRPLLD